MHPVNVSVYRALTKAHEDDDEEMKSHRDNVVR